MFVRKELTMNYSPLQPDGFFAQDKFEIQAFILGKVLVGFNLHPSQSQIQGEGQEIFTLIMIGGNLLDWIPWMTSSQRQKKYGIAKIWGY